MMLRTVRRCLTHPYCSALAALLFCFALVAQQSLPLFAQSPTTLPDEPIATETIAPTESKNSSSAATTVFMPLLANDFNGQLSDRMGFGTTAASIKNYPEIRSLNAGWYVDWGASANAARPGGIEYMPMVRLHQLLTCGKYVQPDRTACPYVEPHAYEYSPSADRIKAIAQKRPGMTWLIGNEMDRLDWKDGGQDEMLPDLYAEAYHELHGLIKAADPTAKIAIGGIIQPTPLRLQYLTTAWDTYKSRYGTDMPVDVWNVHAFVASEFCQWEKPDGSDRVLRCYGAGVPPGATVKQGSYIGEDWKHIDRATFAEQIRAMRQWMKDRGQQQKPLIVTEYGVLYTSVVCNNSCPNAAEYDLTNADVVHRFMLWTFDYFLNTKDCDLGYGADDCRLVQRWAWFSLEDVQWEFNPHTVLFDRDTKAILPAGQLFREYSRQHDLALD